MKDIFIISYNEGNELFDKNDCDELFADIWRHRPNFIFVGTQESKSGTNKHYQHFLREELKSLNYKLLYKMDASYFGIKITDKYSDKNVRSRLYYNTEHVSINKNKVNNLLKTKSINIPDEYSYRFGLSTDYSKFKENINSNQNKNILIDNVSFTKTKGCGFGSLGIKKTMAKSIFSKLINIKKAPAQTIFKSSICTKLIFERNGEEYKFIFVNSHLFYKKKNNTGLEDRQNEFECLVNEFGLPDKLKDGYNIFFLGDLNFRSFRNDLFMSNSLETNIQKKYNLSKNLVDKYLKNKFIINKIKDEIKNKIEELFKQYFHKNFFSENYFSKEKFSKKKYYSVMKEFIKSTDIHEIKLKLEQEQELDKYINIEEEFIKNGELYIFLDKFIEKKIKNYTSNNLNETFFYETILKNLLKSNFYLTSKYKTNINNNQNILRKTEILYDYNKLNLNDKGNFKNITTKDNEKKNISEVIEEVFDILPSDGYIRAPSQTDVILFALSNDKIVKVYRKNFKMYLTPAKSDHKMISLLVDIKHDLYNFNLNNLINNNNTDNKTNNNTYNNKYNEYKKKKNNQEYKESLSKDVNNLSNFIYEGQ
jgi:hypothetical protein